MECEFIESATVSTGRKTYQDVLTADAQSIPPDLCEQFPLPFSDFTINREVYLSADFHRLELDRMWSRVWQMACREEQIPEVGDFSIYDIGDISIVVVRAEATKIRAYYNSCRHRGRKLCVNEGSVKELRCPYHGFTWDLSGKLRRVPAGWDFPHLDRSDRHLSEVKVETWAGFVFINMDAESDSLQNYMECLPSELAVNHYERRYIAGHSQHILPANWKNVLESFMEGLHGPETHAHAWPHLSDILQCDVRPSARHVNRSLHAVGLQVAEDHAPITEQEIMDRYYRNMLNGKKGLAAPRLPTATTARRYIADIMRLQYRLQTGRDVAQLCDSEAIDVLQYMLFPNLVVFRGISLPTVLRFRPHGNDHNSCIFDLFYLVEIPAGAERPRPAATVHMAEDDSYEGAGILPEWLGYVYDQDMDNIKNMRSGLSSLRLDPLVLSQQHESRIRHFHMTLNDYLALDSNSKCNID
jgi:nitrite reductase/ring-hydroxylating ferredoxin subunit